MCGQASSEPISREVKQVRNSAACTIDNADVLRIKPREAGNLANVRNVESIFQIKPYIGRAKVGFSPL